MLAAIAIAIALALALAALRLASAPAPAIASPTLDAMVEDDAALVANPPGALAQFRMLGANVARLDTTWSQIAPNPLSHRRPRGFNAANPAAYPRSHWATLDTIVRNANRDGIKLNIDLSGGAPLWATGPGAPRGKPLPNWEPSAREFGAFVHAVATRYSGSYVPAGSSTPLPPISYWSIWNEPDYGPSLAPQGLPGHLTIEHSPWMYRNLVDAAWSALKATGHGSDIVIIGEVAPRGENYWGVFSGMKPMRFMRAMYCVDSRYRPLRGTAAKLRGCPTTPAGSRRFRAAHPGLFQATGVADHPYMRWYRPNREAQPDPDYSTLGELGVFERGLDRLQRVYGSHKRFPIYDTEFGYITSPPKHDNQLEPGNHRYPWVSQATAAYYLNWAEYISWRDPRVASFNQYLLRDPLPALSANDWGGFASGLINFNGTPKAGYDAWRLPLYLPVTSIRHGHTLEVWGCARPASFAQTDTGQAQVVNIQYQPGSHGPFTTIKALTVVNRRGYFDVRVAFPASGAVRLTWDYPSSDPLLGDLDPLRAPHTVTSRNVQVIIH
jgi:hypothetical protein